MGKTKYHVAFASARILKPSAAASTFEPKVQDVKNDNDQ